MLKAEDIAAAAEALTDLVVRSAANREAAACLAPVLPAILAAMVTGAAVSGRAGFSDRSMLARMLGMPWATGSEVSRGTKTAALEAGVRLEQALNQNLTNLKRTIG